MKCLIELSVFEKQELESPLDTLIWTCSCNLLSQEASN